MGGNESKSHSKRKPTTSTGFLGRARHTKDYTKILVKEINGQSIGNQIRIRCGNEGRHAYLQGADETTLRFLRAAHSFIPDAEDDGADMTNAAFILHIPGREIVLMAGSGEWEYDFREDADGEIYGRCVRQTMFYYVCDKVKLTVMRIFQFAGSSISSILAAPLLALK